MGLLSAPEGNAAARGVGIGLRASHYREFLDSHPQADWLEVHSENYFGDGGYDLHVLEHVRSQYPVSLHGVALSLGSADGVRAAHLAKLKRLVDRIEPALVSEHLCWSALGPRHFNDLLPMPYTGEALQRVVSHVTQVQETLRRRILIENVSSYLQFRASEMSEFAFLAELAKRSGCGILLDVNNVFVNSVNHGFDPEQALLEIAQDAVDEIHLAGHSAAGELLIDDHGSRVVPQVWSLYQTACRRFGPAPTLIEWDTSIPALEVLLDEAAMAARLSQATHA
jgi:uncharacterized protein (UPF0276 family)